MSSLTIHLPDRPWLPIWPKWLRRRRMRAFTDAFAHSMETFVSATQEQQKVYRRICFTTYAAKRLDEHQRQITKAHKQFKGSLNSSLDPESMVKAAKTLQSIGSTLKDSITFDEGIRSRCETQEQRFLELESLANRYKGDSRRDLDRKLEQFRQRRRELPVRKRHEDVIAIMRDLEAITQSLDRSISGFERTRERAVFIGRDSEKIDQQLLNAAPEAANRFANVCNLNKLVVEAIEKGDFGTASSLCNRAEEMVKAIREDLDKLKSYSAAEIQEWHAYLSRGSSLSSAFLGDLEKLFNTFDADTVTCWKQVRLVMEPPILSIARKSRLANRAIARRSNHSLYPDLDRLMNLDVLESFARGVSIQSRRAFHTDKRSE
ncbi:MAG: hypothetical protein JWO13_1673 [Acidobacteriales bacterium]|nr:hypothetical protein [Terriglobales bacterium]